MDSRRRIALLTLLLAGIAVVAAPGVVLAYVLLGGVSLGIGTSGFGYQRDIRVFNSFADGAANNNTVPESTHPGALGAPLAVWKGAQAWSSHTFDVKMNANVNKKFEMD